MNPVRVLVVDDQALFRRVMSAVVDETEGFVAGGLRSVGRGIDRGSRSPAPGSDPDGREPPRYRRDGGHPQAARGYDSAAVVLLSTYDEDDWDGQAQECGAVAYVAKSAFGPDTLTAVWAVTGG